MVLAPRKLATAVLVCRSIAVLLEAAALSYSMIAADLSFSSLVILRMVLSIHLPFSVVRLMYDAAQVFLLEPLPADGWLMATLVASDWILLQILYVAGVGSAAVVDYLYRGLAKCPFLPSHFCARYRAAAVFTLAAWAVNVPIAFMVAYIGVFWYLATAAAQAAAAAAEAEAAVAAAEEA